MKKHLLSPVEVKELLQVEDFRSISKDKLIEFVSAIPNMDKEVAIRIIEQFPVFSEYAQVMVKQIMQLSDSILSANESSHQSIISAYSRTLDFLHDMSKREDLSSEERRWFTEKSVEIVYKIAEFDKDNKVFLITVLKIGAGILGGGLLLCAAIFGVNIRRNN